LDRHAVARGTLLDLPEPASAKQGWPTLGAEVARAPSANLVSRPDPVRMGSFVRTIMRQMPEKWPF
jgi:hypothetical protein